MKSDKWTGGERRRKHWYMRYIFWKLTISLDFRFHASLNSKENLKCFNNKMLSWESLVWVNRKIKVLKVGWLAQRRRSEIANPSISSAFLTFPADSPATQISGKRFKERFKKRWKEPPNQGNADRRSQPLHNNLFLSKWPVHWSIGWLLCLKTQIPSENQITK